MSFYYDQFASKRSSIESKKTNFFSTAFAKFEKNDHHVPSETKHPKSNLSKEKGIDFIAKIRAKIGRRKQCESELLFTEEQLSKAYQSVSQNQHLLNTNFLSDDFFETTLNSFLKVLRFFYSYVFKFKVDKFASDFWMSMIARTAQCLSRLAMLIDMNFTGTESLKIGLLQWMSHQSERNELGSSMEEFLRLTVAFLKADFYSGDS